MKEAAKILLTINLEGVLSQATESHVLPYVKHDEKGKKVIKTGTFVFKQRIPSKCLKKTTLSKEVYDYFTSNNEIPEWYRAKKHGGRRWEELSVHEKLVLHLQRFADGRTFSFEILED